MVKTFIDKLIGRTIDMVYCERCDISNSLFPIEIGKINYPCPRCGLFMKKTIIVKIESKKN